MTARCPRCGALPRGVGGSAGCSRGCSVIVVDVLTAVHRLERQLDRVLALVRPNPTDRSTT